MVMPFNGLVVRYRDVDGKHHQTLIKDADPTNPANAHKIKRWAILNLQSAATRASARVAGEAWLRENNSGRWVI